MNDTTKQMRRVPMIAQPHFNRDRCFISKREEKYIAVGYRGKETKITITDGNVYINKCTDEMSAKPTKM